MSSTAWHGRAPRVARNINFFAIHALPGDFLIRMKFYVPSELFRGVFVTRGRLANVRELSYAKSVGRKPLTAGGLTKGLGGSDLTDRHPPGEPNSPISCLLSSKQPRDRNEKRKLVDAGHARLTTSENDVERRALFREFLSQSITEAGFWDFSISHSTFHPSFLPRGTKLRSFCSGEREKT